MEKIETWDGSITFYNKEFDDIYHSKTGAYEECVHKFVLPCKKLFEKNELIILDVCFGFGYNTSVLIDEYFKINPNGKLVIYGLENDSKVIEMIKDIDFQSESYNLIKYLVRENQIKCNKKNFELNIILGDARETIKQIKNDVDIIFFDPFAPKKCPELWTEKFISDVVSKLKKGGILTTYSCARVVRDNMKKAGLEIFDGPSLGRRAPSTIGIKS